MQTANRAFDFIIISSEESTNSETPKNETIKPNIKILTFSILFILKYLINLTL